MMAAALLLQAKRALYVVLLCTFVGNGYCSQALHLRGSSSGTGPEIQYCGTSGFYCTVDQMCKSGREQRCAGTNICKLPDQPEPNCFESSQTPNKYIVKLGHAELFGSSGSKKSLFNYKKEHQFIQYRGFTYEFGESYGVQILDIDDPNYKYLNNRGLINERLEDVGESDCTWMQVQVIIDTFNKVYELDGNNCQDFAMQLKNCLTGPECSSARGKRHARLQRYVDRMLRQAPCNDNGISSGSLATRSRAMFIAAVLIFIRYVI